MLNLLFLANESERKKLVEKVIQIADTLHKTIAFFALQNRIKKTDEDSLVDLQLKQLQVVGLQNKCITLLEKEYKRLLSKQFPKDEEYIKCTLKDNVALHDKTEKAMVLNVHC